MEKNYKLANIKVQGRSEREFINKTARCFLESLESYERVNYKFQIQKYRYDKFNNHLLTFL